VDDANGGRLEAARHRGAASHIFVASFVLSFVEFSIFSDALRRQSSRQSWQGRLSYDFSPAGMTGMSRRTVEKFAKRVAQLDEQAMERFAAAAWLV
jgi:hypothetical protein